MSVRCGEGTDGLIMCVWEEGWSGIRMHEVVLQKVAEGRNLDRERSQLCIPVASYERR
jgi:hypothetical protein